MKNLTILASIGILTALIGCGDPPQHVPLLPYSVGERCTVYLRRDAMGMSGDLPAPPRASSLNGVELAVTGELLETNSSWIRIKTDTRTCTIPCSVVLMVEQAGE